MARNPPAKGDSGDAASILQGVRKIPWRRKLQPIPVFLLRKILWTEETGGL